MKIIAHRGASGLALENTLPSIELANLLGVDSIEIDIRRTKDGHFVVCHDDDIYRISGIHKKISRSTLAQIQDITLLDGQSTVPTLKQAIETAKDTPLIIEVKITGAAKELANYLATYNSKKFTIASFHHREAVQIKSLAPNIKVYLAERTNMFEIITNAKQSKVEGIDLNFWLLNPLTYFFAKRYKLDIMAYTVNSRLLAWIIHWLYPSVAICTNHPEWFIKHPWLKLKTSGKRIFAKD